MPQGNGHTFNLQMISQKIPVCQQRAVAHPDMLWPTDKSDGSCLFNTVFCPATKLHRDIYSRHSRTGSFKH